MVSLPRVFVPARSADDWRSFLADPEKHWRIGYSARTLACCWQEANGFPASVRAALNNVGGVFEGVEVVLALPEHKVPLPPTSARPSQTDLFVLARSNAGLLAITVEGKVAEPFGPLVTEWLGNDPSPGKRTRLSALCRLLGLNDDKTGVLRYQLLHRTASALIEANRFTAPQALMLVHSFSDEDIGFSDYAALARALGADNAEADSIVRVGTRDGIMLSLGWVRGEPWHLIDTADQERINALPDAEKMLVTLIGFERNSLAHAAEVLGISLAEATSLYRSAVRRLGSRVR